MKDKIVTFYRGTGVSTWRNPTDEQVKAMQDQGWILKEDWVRMGRPVLWPDQVTKHHVVLHLSEYEYSVLLSHLHYGVANTHGGYRDALKQSLRQAEELNE